MKNIYIAIDGPKENNVLDLSLVFDSQRIAKKAEDWGNVKTSFSAKNLGCYRGVVHAIDWFFSHERRGIILEDDLIFNAELIRYLSGCLQMYENKMNIGSVCGYNYWGLHELSDYMCKSIATSFPSSWGWATWRNRWQLIERDFKNYPLTLFFVKNFHFGGILGLRNWMRIRNNLISGKLDSWAYRWVFTHLRRSWVVVVAPVNLVANIGFRNDATHTKDSEKQSNAIERLIDIKALITDETPSLKLEYDNWQLEKIFGVFSLRKLIKRKLNRINQ